jgi:hypothetical protein
MTVGTTRINGNAGVSVNLTAFLAGDLSEIRVPAIANSMGWSYGTGAGAVDVIYADTHTLTLGSTITIDLLAGTPGTLLDIFGRALTLDALKFLYIKNTSVDSGLWIGGQGADDLLLFKAPGDIIYVPPGGFFAWADPSAAGIDTTTQTDLKLEDDSGGVAGDRYIEVIAMGLDD